MTFRNKLSIFVLAVVSVALLTGPLAWAATALPVWGTVPSPNRGTSASIRERREGGTWLKARAPVHCASHNELDRCQAYETIAAARTIPARKSSLQSGIAATVCVC